MPRTKLNIPIILKCLDLSLFFFLSHFLKYIGYNILPVLFFHKSSTHYKVVVYMNSKAFFAAVIIGINPACYPNENPNHL